MLYYLFANKNETMKPITSIETTSKLCLIYTVKNARMIIIYDLKSVSLREDIKINGHK